MEQARRRLDTESRRAEILEAAHTLYATAPYSEVTVAQVAERSGASQALIFHYFGNKAGLYTAVVDDALARLRAAQSRVIDALPPGVPVRDKVRASLEVYLDQVAANPSAWAGAPAAFEEPAVALRARRDSRAEWVRLLGDLLGVGDWPRHTYALWGYFGFVDEICRRWAAEGTPADRRGHLLDAALGALQGALGDWSV